MAEPVLPKQFPSVGDYIPDHKNLLRRVVNTLGIVQRGKTNNTGEITLASSTAATDVVLTKGELTPDTVITFMPTTANAAAEIGAGTIYVSTVNADDDSTGGVAKYSFRITHASNTQGDRIFKYSLIGQRMDIIPLSTDAAIAMWGEISPILDPAIRFCGGKYHLNDVLDDIRAGTAQVWMVKDGVTITGISVTHVVDYARKTMLLVLCLAGKDFSLWDNIVKDHFIPYAKRHNCAGIEFLGRNGWIKRAAKLGFTPIHTVFQLDIDQGGQ